MNQSKWAPKPSDGEVKVGLPLMPTPNHTRTPTSSKLEEPRPVSSSLSAAAPTFSPAPPSPGLSAPPPDVSTVDTFAQTGVGEDNLFDDVIPLDESMRVRSDDDLFSDDFTPVAQPVAEQATPLSPPNRGNQHRDRGRGRGRGRGAYQSRNDPVEHATPPQEAGSLQPETDIAPAENSPPQHAPTGPRKEAVPSVRGDRQATGGLRKPKLTEEELAEKMARISIKNASLTAAHARAEADAASFAQREQQAKQFTARKQREERRDRQQMMGEREKNRMRKLKAMEGREWDAEKRDEDFQRGGTFDKRGGFAGDRDDYSDGREYLYRESRGGDRGSGGTTRGARHGRPQAASAPKPEDFPALPAADASTGETLGDHAADNSSWADQVESSDA